MNLNPTQLQALKAAILAETDPTFVSLRTTGQTGAMAAWFNLLPAADVLLWNPRAKATGIFDQVVWDKYTPTDVADGSTAAFKDRAEVIKIKQMNLQNMLAFRDVIDATKANIRLGVRDAVIQIPSGVAGAMTTAGGVSGVNVLTAMTRKATRGEALYATAVQAVGTPTSNPVLSAYLPVVEGAVTNENVVAALA